MNKKNLITAVAAKTEMPKKETEVAVNALMDVISETLCRGEKVQIVGFGSFEVKRRAARTGRNPQTKEPIPIAESKAPVFKAGKALKEAVDR